MIAPSRSNQKTAGRGRIMTPTANRCYASSGPLGRNRGPIFGIHAGVVHRKVVPARARCKHGQLIPL